MPSASSPWYTSPTKFTSVRLTIALGLCIVNFENAAVGTDEKEYEEVIDRLEGASKLTELRTEVCPRCSSFAERYPPLLVQIPRSYHPIPIYV
jgi:hypothetical protein